MACENKASGRSYISEMKRIADGEGLTNVLMIIDREGALGESDEARRGQSVVRQGPSV